MKRSWQLVVALGFILLSLWVTWPLAIHLDEALPGDLGDPLLNTWILGWDADRLHHGLSGLWNAPILFPYRHTLAFSEHLLGIAVPVAPIVWLTGRPFVAYNVAFIASFAFAAIAMWRLARRLTGRDDVAIVAGAIFAFAPARLGQIGHLQVLMSGWMPLALLALHRYFDTKSRWALAAFTAAFIAQGLSNGYYLYFLALPVAIICVHALVTRVTDRRTIAIGLVISAAAIAAAFAPIAAVYFDVRHTYGLERSEDEVSTFGADLGAYLHGNEALRPPIRIWRALPHYDKPGGPEGEIFPGMAAILLAGLAFWPRPRASAAPASLTTAVRLYGAIGAAAILLSMGADPAIWGVRLPLGWIYRSLFASVPGFNGLRVPARFSTVVLLAMAVLAAVGLMRIVERLSPRAGATVTAAVLLFILLEGTGGAMPLAFLPPHGRPDRAAYAWVRDAGPGAVLELPAGELDTNLRTYQYEYQTLFHHHPLVNGASGYTSALQVFLGSAASPLVEPDYFDDGLRMLRRLGVNTVVVRPQAFQDAAVGAAIADQFKSRVGGQVVSEAVFPGVFVYRLAEWHEGATPAGEAGGRPIPPSAFVATASHAADRVMRAFDGSMDTRWVSGERQSGNEWIEIRFDRPRDVSRLRFLTADRSYGDYPRELIVETIEGANPPRTLYRGTVVEQLASGLVADPLHAPIDIVLPSNHADRLRLRQAGRTRIWFWSVDELELYER
jgi:MFS family permease